MFTAGFGERGPCHGMSELELNEYEYEGGSEGGSRIRNSKDQDRALTECINPIRLSLTRNVSIAASLTFALNVPGTITDIVVGVIGRARTSCNVSRPNVTR